MALRARLVTLCCLLLAGLAPGAVASEPAHIAIIIDDMGHSYRKGRAAIHLPAPLTFAFLPYTRHVDSLANRAHHLGKEVMVHMPMENDTGQPADPGTLDHLLTPDAFHDQLHDAIRRVPYAQGLNNHMGSHLTRDMERMQWVMASLKPLGLYFVDSRTTAQTVAHYTADAYGLPVASRDVFLDNERSQEAIQASFNRLLTLAQRNGTAIGIGHPYPETIAFLKEALPQLATQDIEIVPVSKLINLRRSQGIDSAAASD